MEHDARSCTGSARCWVLRRHLPVGGLFFLVAAPGLDRLTHPLGAPLLGWVGVVVVVVGFGVWWCVECCIVDASIFFCVWFCGLCVFVVCEVL